MTPTEKLREIMRAHAFNPDLDFSTPLVARAFAKWVLEEAALIADVYDYEDANDRIRAFAAKLDGGDE